MTAARLLASKRPVCYESLAGSSPADGSEQVDEGGAIIDSGSAAGADVPSSTEDRTAVPARQGRSNPD
jgi:hypothetical protein